MDKMHIIWGFQWIFYCFLHSFLANNYIKAKVIQYLKMGSNGYRMFYNCLAFVHLSVLVWFHLKIPSPMLFEKGMATDVFAVLITLAGLTVMVICVLKYFRQLSGISPAADKARLYTGGLHAYVRHPLYLGTFLFLAGLFLYWPFLKNALVVGIIICYTLIGIILEEKKLVGEFGAAYKEYRKNVPMIIPGFGPRRKKTNSPTGTLIN